MKFRRGLKLLSMQDFGLRNNNSFYKTFEILNCVKAINDFLYIYEYLQTVIGIYQCLFVEAI